MRGGPPSSMSCLHRCISDLSVGLVKMQISGCTQTSGLTGLGSGEAAGPGPHFENSLCAETSTQMAAMVPAGTGDRDHILLLLRSHLSPWKKEAGPKPTGTTWKHPSATAVPRGAPGPG